MDIDKGLESVVKFKGIPKEDGSGFKVMPCRLDLIEVVSAIEPDEWFDFAGYAYTNHKKYDLIVCDSMTEFINRSVEKAKGDSVYANKREWGYAYDKCSRFMRLMAKVPVHKIFLTHETEEKIPVGQDFVVHYSPKIPGQSNNLMQELTNETWRASVTGGSEDKPPVYFLQCQKSEFVHAKTRSGLNMFEPMNIDKVFAKMLA